MATITSALLWLTLLSVVVSVSEQTIIRAGQTVSLPCKAPNNEPVIAVDWSRTDMKEGEYVLSYRDGRFVTVNQNPSYMNRVDLQDRQMKDGDVSLILKNVTTDDSGTYECRVQTKTNRRKRDTGPITTIKLHVDPERRTIRAESGQTVSLPCKALNEGPVIVLEWRRTDMKEDEYVLSYRDETFTIKQNSSFENRVDLQDRQMKDGDVSLILNNVMTDDSGTYECYINQREKNTIKKFIDPISIIRLDVGHTDRHKEDGKDKEGGDKDGSVGLVVGLIVAAVVGAAAGVVGFLVFRRRRRDLNPGPYHPPPE